MKIVIINHEFPPAGGGAASACERMATYLAALGHELEIITSKVAGQAQQEYKNKYLIKRVLGYRHNLHTGKIWEVLLFVIHGFIYFTLWGRKQRPDVVYTFFTLPAGMLGLALKIMYRYPYYVFLRGIDVPGFYGGKFSVLNKIFKPLIRYIWIHSDTIVANSQYLQRLAYNTLRSKPIVVIPNSVDTRFFSASKRTEDKTTVKILFVGRLNKQKGLDCLLEAIAKLIKMHLRKDFFVEIIGDGRQRPDLTRKSESLRIMNKVTFVGWLDKIRLLAHYQSADIFISPSLDEGMPNVIMEAMACGLPIIASDIPAHKEFITQDIHGVLVPLNDSGALARAFKMLIEDERLRRRMGQENLDYIAQYSIFNMERFFSKVIAPT